MTITFETAAALAIPMRACAAYRVVKASCLDHRESDVALDVLVDAKLSHLTTPEARQAYWALREFCNMFAEFAYQATRPRLPAIFEVVHVAASGTVDQIEQLPRGSMSRFDVDMSPNAQYSTVYYADTFGQNRPVATLQRRRVADHNAPAWTIWSVGESPVKIAEFWSDHVPTARVKRAVRAYMVETGAL